MLYEEDLIKFEEEIKELFLQGKIRSPVHLAVGAEKELIKIFKRIKKNDWVFSTHRSHYHALLKGVDRDWLKKEILANRSIHINNKLHKLFSSAIMASNLPVAVGVAMALKRKKSSDKVWAICGDMTAEMGVAHECMKYAARQELPIAFIIEDNGLSVETDTQEVWGKGTWQPEIYRFKYNRKYPHQGAGKWVVF